MTIKSSLDGSADHLKCGKAQEIPPLRNYLCLTMFTCFCPAWPINIVALVFSVLAQMSYDKEDYDVSKQLGRKALHLGIASFAIGLVIITAYTVVHFTTLGMQQIYGAKINRRIERFQVSFSSPACGVTSCGGRGGVSREEGMERSAPQEAEQLCLPSVINNSGGFARAGRVSLYC